MSKTLLRNASCFWMRKGCFYTTIEQSKKGKKVGFHFLRFGFLKIGIFMKLLM